MFNDNRVERVISYVKNKKIFAVDISGLEDSIGDSEDVKCHCWVYENVGNFINRVLYETVLTETQVSSVIQQFSGQWWIREDVNRDDEYGFGTVRFHCLVKPQLTPWSKINDKGEVEL